ncbi:hypothetical protein ABW21_db0205598 [Orbilia brochopaga]|nr:hypothetical protein ABW21_db0205598 [Drechslerella brochopaga]
MPAQRKRNALAQAEIKRVTNLGGKWRWAWWGSGQQDTPLASAFKKLFYSRSEDSPATTHDLVVSEGRVPETTHKPRASQPALVIDTEELGLKVLHEPTEEEIIVDIVAVHGLAADPDQTWTYRNGPASDANNGVNWLKDANMLPAALPRARIMRFGYDSTWYGLGAVNQRLANVAEAMLEDLEYERESYNLAKANDSDYPSIWKSITGMIFLGTPHQGASNQIYQAIAGQDVPTEQGILKYLAKDNETVIDVVGEYTRLINLCRINIYCLFEQKSTVVRGTDGETRVCIIRDASLKSLSADV